MQKLITMKLYENHGTVHIFNISREVVFHDAATLTETVIKSLQNTHLRCYDWCEREIVSAIRVPNEQLGFYAFSLGPKECFAELEFEGARLDETIVLFGGIAIRAWKSDLHIFAGAVETN